MQKLAAKVTSEYKFRAFLKSYRLPIGAVFYFNNPLIVNQKLHKKFPLKLEHFRRLVKIFGATVDKLFTGETAKNAKLRAKIISYSLNQRTNQDSTQINSKTSN